jgi:hypothetical protein
MLVARVPLVMHQAQPLVRQCLGHSVRRSCGALTHLSGNNNTPALRRFASDLSAPQPLPNRPYRVLFFGTDSFSLASLKLLHENRVEAGIGHIEVGRMRLNNVFL